MKKNIHFQATSVVSTLSPAVFFDIPAYFTSNLRVKEWEPESLREIVEKLLLIINL